MPYEMDTQAPAYVGVLVDAVSAVGHTKLGVAKKRILLLAQLHTKLVLR
jgi:hypothetical protein